MDHNAQGTIEYLVIIAIVVVISLIVVVLLLNQTSSVSETDQKTTNMAWKTKEVKIVDFAVSADGVGTIVLSSNLSDGVTLTSIVVDSADNPVSGQIFFSSSQSFSLTNLPFCTGQNKKYFITLNYISKEGLSKSVSGEFYANCLAPLGIDSIAPVVLLNSPNGTLTNRIVDFNFNVTEANTIASCTLYVGEDSNTYTGIISGENIVRYTFDSDIPVSDWNVICIDGNSNVSSIESSLQLAVSTASPTISVLLSSPEDKTIFYERNVSFEFTPTSSNGVVSSCTLNIGSDSNTYYNLTNGAVNTITYGMSVDEGSFNWDINCTNGESWDSSTSRLFSIGTNSIQLSTCQQIQSIDTNNTTRAGNYILTQDINCYDDTHTGGALYNSGAGFRPIGTWNTRFTGKFNGAGHTISGLYINRTTIDSVGLFGCSDSGAVIQNVHLQDPVVIGKSNVGSLIGQALGKVISASASFDSIQGSGSYIGGLVGQVYGYSSLFDFNDLDVNANSVRGVSNVGGIVGGMSNFSSSNTSGVLFNRLNANISDGIYSNGSYVGGLVGNASSIGSTIRNSSVDVNYIYSGTGDIQYVGGLVGFMDGNIYDSFSFVDNIDINKSTGAYGYFGGLAGKAGFVSGSYSIGDIDATLGTYSGGSNRGYVGGLVGYSSNGISDSYSRGNFVLATKLYGNYVGGLAGYTEGPVYDSNAVFDEIKGVHSVGGLIGAHSVASVGNHLSGLFADVNVVSASYRTYSYAGGLVGVVYGYSGLSDFNDSSVRVGLVSGGNYVGGAIGAMSNFTSNNSVGVNFNNVDVEVTDKIIGVSYLGGLIGQSLSIGSTIRSSSADINYIYSVGDSQFVGGLVGQTDGNIYDSSIVFGEIDVNKSSGSWGYFGGLGGKVGFVSNCFSIGDSIDATLGAYSGGSNYSGVGGLVGYSSKGISNSYSRGNFILATKSNGKNVGGLAGGTEGPVYDSNAIFDEIKGYSSVGGLIGSHSVAVAGSHLRGLFADVNVVSASYGTYSYAGGLVGVIYGYSGLSDFNDSSVSVGRVSGGNYVGGAIGAMSNFTSNNSVGVNFNNVDVEVNDKIISNGSYIGGMIGQILSIGSTVKNCNLSDVNYIYAGTGDIQFVGGLVGKTDGNIYDSSFIGKIDLNKSGSTNAYIGGLAGSANFINGSFSEVDINTSLGTYSGPYVGGLVGYSINGISNSYSRGNFISVKKSSGNSVGGLVGYVTGRVMDSNSNFREIIGSGYYIGGLIGAVASLTSFVDFNNLDADVDYIGGANYVGGLIGYVGGAATNGIYLNESTVTVSDRIYVTNSNTGGLIGHLLSSGSRIRNSSADINYILANGNYVKNIGGLVGEMDGNIYDSFAIVNNIDIIKGYESLNGMFVGGLAGRVGFVSGSYSDANINASLGTYSGATNGGRIGGLVGDSSKGIENSYASGKFISATKSYGNFIGGLVGYISVLGTITNSYSSVENIYAGSNSYVGGLVGYGYTYLTGINNSFSTPIVTSTGSSVGKFIGSVSCAPACITNSYYLDGSNVMLYSASPSVVSSSGVDYFKGNLTNAPMSSWDPAIWSSAVLNYPQLS